jgi:hypothetical protein
MIFFWGRAAPVVKQYFTIFNGPLFIVDELYGRTRSDPQISRNSQMKRAGFVPKQYGNWAIRAGNVSFRIRGHVSPTTHQL